MAICKIIRYPAPSLRLPCRAYSRELAGSLPFGAFSGHVRDLRDTLAATPHGLALASNQILAEGWRVFVVRPGTVGPAVACMGIKGGVQPMPEVCIDPVWRSYEPTALERANFTKNEREHRSFVEGCLSVPELALPTARPYFVELEYTDEAGTRCIVVLQGLLARIAVHECDHLGGILIVDQADRKTQIRVHQEAVKNRKRGR